LSLDFLVFASQASVEGSRASMSLHFLYSNGV
jgi:hypothetical protein